MESNHLIKFDKKDYLISLFLQYEPLLTDTQKLYIWNATGWIEASANLNITDGIAGQVLATDGAGNYPFADIAGGGGGASGFAKTYSYSGSLSVNTGLTRNYIYTSATLATADIFLTTAGDGTSINISVKKNGSEITTMSIPAGQVSVLNNVINSAFVKGDYLTVDITQVGSSYSGSDLVINFIFN